MVHPLRSASGDNSLDDRGRKKKRKRNNDFDKEKLKQYGIDLPVIPGIPVQLIPLHVHALKATSKFFRLVASEVFVPPFGTNVEEPNQHNEMNDVSVDSSSKGSVLGSVFSRIEQVASIESSSADLHRRNKEIESEKTSAINTWIEAIHRSLKDSRSKDAKNNMPVENDAIELEKQTSNVPISALNHILEMGIQHKRVSVRRASTHALSYLLAKSSDCRAALFNVSDTNSLTSKPLLMEWMNSTINASSTLEIEHENSNEKGVHLLQRETYILFQNLDEMGYSDWYPTLPVTIQRFQQFCTNAVEADSLDDFYIKSNEAERRRVRDEAMELFEKVGEKVSKLVTKAQRYLDILVPRIGSPIETGTKVSKDNDENEEDDSSVEWQDGWDNESSIAPTTSNAATHDPDQSFNTHIDAVENTLALMEASGGLREGKLEIDLGRSSILPLHDMQSESDTKLLVTRKRLLKLAQNLKDQYLPRLSTWVDSLSKADGLVLVSKGGSTALMRMTSDQKERRKDALECLKLRRNSVILVLQQANRLVTVSDSMTNGDVSLQSGASRNSCFVSNHNAELSATTNKGRFSSVSAMLQRKLNRPSNKIQIKLRK